MRTVITRFPPSPTGYLHVGGARTALFNWFYARHTQGRFVLRIEDTDTLRSTQASADAIFEALEWLGIDWDEGPYFQSKRFHVYTEYVQKLLDTDHAYYCTCSLEKLDAMREQAMANGGKPKYDWTCRDKQLSKSSDAVVRFRAPQTGTTVIHDVVKGNIVFQNAEQDDFIIQRSDGTPTYNFVVVVDDITMGINTVIRGDDHVNNTPRQIMLYHALGAELPVFGHVPMVLGKDKTRLSKRHGAMSVTAYRDMGVLPEAMINYLIRLGWSCGDQEFFTREDLIEKFSLEHIGKSASVFDMDKLLSLNADHIKATPPRALTPHLLPFLKARGYAAEEGHYLDQVILTLNARSKTLDEMAEAARFYYEEAVFYDPAASGKFMKSEALEPLTLLFQKMESAPDFTVATLEAIFLSVMEATGLKLGKIAQPVRVALTGKTASPGIFEIMEILGKTQVIARLNQAIRFLVDSNESGG